MKNAVLPPMQKEMLENLIFVFNLTDAEEQMLRLTADALFMAGERKGMEIMGKSIIDKLK